MDFYNLLTKKNGITKFTDTISIVIILRMKPDIDQSKAYIDTYGSIQCTKKMKLIIEKIRQGFNSGLIPKLTDDGTSGAYLMRNAQKKNFPC